MKKKLTYKDAGVDINAGNKTVELIKPLAKSTSNKNVVSGIGGFGGLFKIPKGYKDPILVAGTDGVGTKLKIAFKLNQHKSIGIDLVAMCVNDIICCGAKPLFFLDYFGTGKLSPKQAKDVVAGIAKGCKESGCVLLGGETAELPGFYKVDEYDLAGFVVGIVDKKDLIDGKTIKTGDALIGVESSGLHSNGYSLGQKVLLEKRFDKSIAKRLLTPTHLYSKLIQKITSKFKIKGIANITGGGLTENTPRMFPSKIGCKIDLDSWKRPKIFKDIQDKGNISNNEMLKTFNNGIGIVLTVSNKDKDKVISSIQKSGFKAYNIGVTTKGSKRVTYKGVF